MTNRYFTILNADHAIFDGHNKLQDSGSVYNGNLATLVGGTSGSVGLSTGSCIGMFFDMLAMTELPTTAELVANIGGERVNIAMGHFEALLGPDLFQAGELPAVNAALYDDGLGQIHTSGVSKIGRCIDHSQTVRTPASGSPIASTYEVARCVFDFVSIL